MRKCASFISRLRNLSTCTVIMLLSSVLAAAQHESVIYAFGTNPGDGVLPNGGLVADAAGNLYGVTEEGGLTGLGTIYELSPGSSPTGWNETVLYSFTGGGDGGGPYGTLVFDKAGNVYGTTNLGGNPSCMAGCGTVFELSPPAAPGGAWTEITIYAFNGGNDGEEPLAGVVFDTAGNLYGTTSFGGTGTCSGFSYPGCGTVFELSPPAIGNDPWTETILYSFSGGSDGGIPGAPVVRDTAGNLYSTTGAGGILGSCLLRGCGTIFELTPTSGKGAWTETVLHSFTSVRGDAFSPGLAGLLLDKSGALAGTTPAGGEYGAGAVFGLRPPSSHGGKWGYGVLYSFGRSQTDGLDPFGALISVNGVLFGTTFIGGVHDLGAAFQLTLKRRVWKETALYSFKGGSDGQDPQAGLLPHNGALFGITAAGGSTNAGTVFKIGP